MFPIFIVLFGICGVLQISLLHRAIAKFCNLLYMLLLPFLIPAIVNGQDTEEKAGAIQNWDSPVETFSRDTLDGAVYISGVVIIPVSKENIWKILTDYDNLKNFIPNMMESAILVNNGQYKTILQKGKSKFLFFSKTVEITLDIEEQKPDYIQFQIKTGPFHIYRGNWSLTELNLGETHLTYEAIIKPDFFSTKFIMKKVLKKQFRVSLEAIRIETKRRNQK